MRVRCSSSSTVFQETVDDIRHESVDPGNERRDDVRKNEFHREKEKEIDSLVC